MCFPMKFRMVIILVLALLAISAAGLNAPGVTQAQEQEKYIDLSVGFTLFEDPNADRMSNKLWLTNRGNRTAYDVRVVLKQVNPTSANYMNMGLCCHMGTIDVQANDSVTSNIVTWSIPRLPPYTQSFIGFRSGINKASDSVLFEWSATAESLSSYESPDRLHDNTAEAFLYGATGVYMPQPSYYVQVSTDGASPEPGGTAEFTVDVRNKYDDDSNEFGENPTGQVSYVSDACVNIWLSPGLTAGTATTNSDTRFPNLQYYPKGQRECGGTEDASGVLYVGGPVNLSVSPQPKLTLPVTVGDAGPYCLTAEIFARPPTGAGLHRDDPADNLGKVCLGAAPPTPLRSGEVSAFTLYPCVGIDTDPCDSTDDVRTRATVPNQNGFIMAPGTAVFHVPDPQARIFDSHVHNGNEQSVNDGSTVSWHTACDRTAGCGTAATPVTEGVKLGWNRIPFNTYWRRAGPPPTGVWTKIGDITTVRGKDGGDPPGKMDIRGSWNRRSYYRMDQQNAYTAVYSGFLPSADTTSVSGYYAEFEKLGTYVFDYTLTATHFSQTGDCDTDADDVNDAFCGTETYVFHVGPLADLEVSGASDAAAGRPAFTVLAANNGPEHEADAQVKIALPAGVLVEDYVASEGTYDNGTWTLPGLKLRDYRRSQGKPEEATLTLILKDGGGAPRDPATATISLTNNSYNVCIGSDRSTLAHNNETDCVAVTGASWHEGTIYDPSGNSTAKIAAAKGTGIGPDIPASVTTQTGTTTTVMWDEVEYLYGIPVARYEVQWLGSDWTALGNAEIGNEYWDAAPTGRRAYRVRAVNEAGYAGRWSRSSVQVPVGSAGSPLNLRTQADGNNAIDVSWDSPEDIGGSPITGYRVEWTTHPEGRWGSGANTSELTYKHRGLQTGAIWWYRVAARNSGGLGLWSDPVQGKTASGTPDAPTLRAETLSDYEIELTWNEPKDNGEPIAGYRIDYSDDGSADSWNRLAEVGADPTTYTDTTLPANTRRYYRVRAVNSVGGGAWSRTVSSITQLTPPDAPSLTSVEPDGPNAIIVTWEEPWYLGDLPITQYQVQWAKDPYSEIWRGPQTLSGSTRSWRHTGLKPGETWHYQVRASNGGGRWSVWSYSSAATTASEKVPTAAPSGLTATYEPAPDDDSVGSVTLKWNTPSGSATTTGYDLQYSEDNNQWEDLEENLNALTYMDDGYHLYPGSQIHYRVRARAAEGAGPWSRSVRVLVPADPPDKPRIMWVEADGSNHIYLEWEPPYYDGGAAITGYGLLWCRALDGADENPCEDAMAESNSPADPPGYRRISLGASQRSYTHSVSPGYYYYYLLRATNGGNRWSEWQEYDFSYARTYAGVPGAPGLRAQAVDANQIKLTWTKPSSSGSEISNYWLYVYQDGEDLHDWDNILDIVTVPGDRTEWTIGDLSPETTRYFRIRALNDNGEGKYSALRQATTPSG